MVWSKQKAKDLILPQIDTTIYVSEIRETSLYLIFFNVVPGKENKF